MEAGNVGSQPSTGGSSNVGSSTTNSNANSGSNMHIPTQSSGATTEATHANASPQATNSTPQSGSSAPEYFEVKINGRSVKMTRDEVIAHAAKAQAADQRFEEAARARKQVEQIINTAKTNPIQALMDPSLGLTKEQIRDAFEKWYTQEFIESETLTPEQKNQKQMERELERYRTLEKENQEKVQREQEERLTTQQREYFSQQIIDAMEKSGLPKTKFFAQRMAFYMRENLKNGWEAPLDLIVSQVKKERQAMMSDLTENAEVPHLIEMLGEGLINKIRKYDLEQLRQRRQNRGTENPSLDGYGNPQSSEKINYSDVNKRLREMRMGKF